MMQFAKFWYFEYLSDLFYIFIICYLILNDFKNLGNMRYVWLL